MWGTILVGTVVLAAVVLIVRKLLRDRKNGVGCGDCAGCSGCASKDDIS